MAIGLLAVWEWLAHTGRVKPLLFPAPSVIGRTTLDMLATGELLLHTRVTVQRMVIGVIAGGVPALLLGMLMGRSARLTRFLDPVIAAIHPIPKVAIFPLIMVFLGIGEPAMIFIAAFGAFFPILINTIAGVRQINPVLLQVAQNYRTSRLKLFTRVILPGSAPSVWAGLLLALNLTLLITISVEIVTPRTGLGSVIWRAWQSMQTEKTYVALLVLMILGLLINVGVRRLGNWLIPWHDTHA